MEKIYGYCRISTPKQNLARQIRNIRKRYPTAIIVEKIYIGTTSNRKEWSALMKVVRAGDCIVFDSVSRMSRNAEDGFEDFMTLYEKSVELVFLKEPHINTAVYKSALSNHIAMTGDRVDIILQAVNQYLMELAKAQIRLGYEQSEKEVQDLRERTREGIQTARLQGKQIGRAANRKYETQKSIAVKKTIKDSCLKSRKSGMDGDVETPCGKFFPKGDLHSAF